MVMALAEVEVEAVVAEVAEVKARVEAEDENKTSIHTIIKENTAIAMTLSTITVGSARINSRVISGMPTLKIRYPVQ